MPKHITSVSPTSDDITVNPHGTPIQAPAALLHQCVTPDAICGGNHRCACGETWTDEPPHAEFCECPECEHARPSYEEAE